MPIVRLLAVALVCQALLFPALALCADSADCAGLVVDENGEPVPEVQITLQSSGNASFRTETDASGRFKFRNLPAGEYKADIRKQGFFLLSDRPLTLRPGTNDVTFTLNHANEIHEQVQVTAAPNQIDP